MCTILVHIILLIPLLNYATVSNVRSSNTLYSFISSRVRERGQLTFVFQKGVITVLVYNHENKSINQDVYRYYENDLHGQPIIVRAAKSKIRSGNLFARRSDDWIDALIDECMIDDAITYRS